MKKIQLRLFAVIIILFFLLPLFFILNPTPLFAENVTITLRAVIRGWGEPKIRGRYNEVEKAVQSA